MEIKYNRTNILKLYKRMSGEIIVKQFFGMSQSGDLKEAVSGMNNPQFIILLSNSAQFESHVKALQGMYPKVPRLDVPE